MDLKLIRTQFRSDGIFGELWDTGGKLPIVTLEHAYDTSPQYARGFAPKIPDGTYQCVRGKHQLAHMTEPFTTFEITGVPGHTNILFHQGNSNDDSEGCVLLGRYILGDKILDSHKAFENFIALQQSCDTFTLEVTTQT